MSNLADITKVVLESTELDSTQKMTLLQSMFTDNSVENNNQSNDTNNGTFKVTVKTQTSNDKKTVFGNFKWEDEARLEMFKVCVDTFGPYEEWAGKTVPGNGIDFEDACEQIATHFGRTVGSIKAQIRDVVMPIEGSKEGQRHTLEHAKAIAFEAGFISEEIALL